jgi:hypothetical protein
MSLEEMYLPKPLMAVCTSAVAGMRESLKPVDLLEAS